MLSRIIIILFTW